MTSLSNALWSTVLLTGTATLSSPAAETIRSGPGRVALLELYTSEGCSSCPPADQRLASLRNQPALWRSIVPVAFHISYWDRLGWRDVFASKTFTQREYAYANAGRVSAVYTPCFMLDGLEWRWNNDDILMAGRKSTSGEAGVLTATRIENGAWRIGFSPAAGIDGPFDIHVALLGGGIVSTVRAGENAGRDLLHEFVVVELTDESLKRGEHEEWSADVRLHDTVPASVKRKSIALWVTHRGELAPVQAAGGWIEPAAADGNSR